MNKHIIQLLLIAILLTACGPAVLPPPPTATATQTIAPSQTPTSPPTQTAIPAITPHPTLQTEGPYLLFTYDNKNFTIMDADGSGQKQFQLPNDGYIWDLEKAVSPDGKWLVFFTGSTEEPYDLALNLFNLSDETALSVSNLIAPGFPTNLEPVTKTIWFTEYDTDCSNNPTCRLHTVEISFREGIWRFDWSPDSQNIAFAAQIDGPSSDVYIYSIENRAIKRLTNELENIGLMISWAPNGEKILYTSSEPGTSYSYSYLHIADPKVNSIQNPKSVEGGIFWRGAGWVNQNSYLILSGGEGAPPHDFRLLNIDTQEITQIWRYTAESFFIYKINGTIFLLTFPGEISGLEPEPEQGLYLVEFDGKFKKLSNEIFTPLQEPGPRNTYFAVQINASTNEYLPLIVIDSDGNVTHLPLQIWYSIPPRVSPNQKYVIISSATGIGLYNENLEQIKLWDMKVSEIIWRPDSLGIFLSASKELYYLSIPDGKPVQVNTCTLEFCLSKYAWLP